MTKKYAEWNDSLENAAGKEIQKEKDDFETQKKLDEATYNATEGYTKAQTANTENEKAEKEAEKTINEVNAIRAAIAADEANRTITAAKDKEVWDNLANKAEAAKALTLGNFFDYTNPYFQYYTAPTALGLGLGGLLGGWKGSLLGAAGGAGLGALAKYLVDNDKIHMA